MTAELTVFQAAAHVHGGAQPGGAALLAAGGALSCGAVYLLASARLRRRGDRWPLLRDLSFGAGAVALVTAALASMPGAPFTAHMVQHLVTGMAAPLLLVLARPVTLALRSLPPGPRRPLLAVVRSRPAGLLVLPPVAALLDAGGLWLLYRTPLFAIAHERPWLAALVHVHVFAAGLLFSAAVCALDPLRRRHGPALRGAALVAAGGAHAVLARTLYATGPPGTRFAAADLAGAAEWMYYGGDLVEIALAVAVAAQWYAAAGRRLAREARRAPPGPGGPPASASYGQ
ncbi:cytochrome c oxidase assembly protein [Streptomyces sp. NBC_01431]|uniref:cytochrome c oxidase assembly protein n=1 Tax=Streptomyces sp. NBC_01431 TaxID=2903863 RepID=UPI002E320B58|nr:cytochrome c oxidase assembly protein [Streptomyces sp. NBC_01431]